MFDENFFDNGLFQTINAMATTAYTILTATNTNGGLYIRWGSSKQGLSFDNLEQLQNAVKIAKARDKEHRLLLALGNYLAGDPTMANPATLNGVTIVASDGQ